MDNTLDFGSSNWGSNPHKRALKLIISNKLRQNLLNFKWTCLF